jgi:hypothetical protein
LLLNSVIYWFPLFSLASLVNHSPRTRRSNSESARARSTSLHAQPGAPCSRSCVCFGTPHTSRYLACLLVLGVHLDALGPSRRFTRIPSCSCHPITYTGTGRPFHPITHPGTLRPSLSRHTTHLGRLHPRIMYLAFYVHALIFTSSTERIVGGARV